MRNQESSSNLLGAEAAALSDENEPINVQVNFSAMTEEDKDKLEDVGPSKRPKLQH